MKIAISIICAVLLATASEGVVNIQNVGSGARAQGLGNSFVAIADNADAVFANPAGLGQVSQRQVSYTNVSLLYAGIEGDDLGQHVVSYAQPLGEKMGLGLGYERIGSSLMSENGAFVSLSYQVERRLQVGLSAKYLFLECGGDSRRRWSAGSAFEPKCGQRRGGFGLVVAESGTRGSGGGVVEESQSAECGVWRGCRGRGCGCVADGRACRGLGIV